MDLPGYQCDVSVSMATALDMSTMQFPATLSLVLKENVPLAFPHFMVGFKQRVRLELAARIPTNRDGTGASKWTPG